MDKKRKVSMNWLLDTAIQPFDEFMSSTDHTIQEKSTRDDLEADLKASQVILEKVCNDVAYAQNLYAALCNTEWCKNEVVPILKEEYWSCSWRYAGAIVANMRQTGDYIDWYCSGISVFVDMDDDTFESLTSNQLEMYHTVKRYVQEGHITDEIRKDMLDMGWIPVDYPDLESN